MTFEPALYVQTLEYSARQDRQWIDLIFTEGVADVSAGELAVSQRAAAANLSVDVAPGTAIIAGDSVARQGKYLVRCTEGENVVIPAPPVSDSRIDLVVLQVHDSTADGGSASLDGAALEVVQGAAAPAPVAPAAPDTAIVLAEVVVAAGAVAITNANITDRRTQLNAQTLHVGNVDVQTFTTSGTWTKPAGATLVVVEAIGAGAAGGGSSSRKGGGGGAFLRRMLDPATLAATETVTVGAGGTASGTGDGASGGASSFGSHVVAPGGKGTREGGGLDMTALGTPSLGATWAGGNGGAGGSQTPTGDGGASAAGGGGGGGGANTLPGLGGASSLSGKGGNGAAGSASGSAGTAPGGGGGGAGGTAPGVGGNGARGEVRVITYF